VIGAALHTYHAVLKQPRRNEEQMNHAYLGPEFSEAQIESVLKSADVKYCRLERAPLLDAVTIRW